MRWCSVETFLNRSRSDAFWYGSNCEGVFMFGSSRCSPDAGFFWIAPNLLCHNSRHSAANLSCRSKPARISPSSAPSEFMLDTIRSSWCCRICMVRAWHENASWVGWLDYSLELEKMHLEIRSDICSSSRSLWRPSAVVSILSDITILPRTSPFQ